MSRCCQANVRRRSCSSRCPSIDVEDRGVGRAIRRAGEAVRQELQKRADGRQRVAAGCGVHELHLDAVAGIQRAASRHVLERLPAARVRIREQRGRFSRRRVFQRQQVGAVARQRVAFVPRDRLRLVGVMLGEARIEHVDDRDVETVHPHDRRVARVAVIVIGPRGRQDEIARVHGRALAVNRGVRALAFDHEAKRGAGGGGCARLRRAESAAGPAYRLCVIREPP